LLIADLVPFPITAFGFTVVDDVFSSRPFHEIETLRTRWSTLPTTFFAI
jgi:hypothetical protein